MWGVGFGLRGCARAGEEVGLEMGRPCEEGGVCLSYVAILVFFLDFSRSMGEKDATQARYP